MGGYWAAAEAERKRVEALIANDRQRRSADTARIEAEREIAAGRFANLDDAVVLPTQEWMDKGDTRSFTPRAPDGTVRSVTTFRRVLTPMVMRMLNAGKLTDDQAAACVWYRKTFEMAGLNGHSSSSQWNPNSTIRHTATCAGFGYVPSSEVVALARDEFRAARAALEELYIPFFEAIVLDDIPMRSAARLAKCRNEKAPRRFRDVAEALLDHCQRAKTVMPSLTDEIDEG